GGDGFDVLAGAKGYRVDTGFLDVEILTDWLHAHPNPEGKAEGRITIQNAPR
ncbi:MAG: hypothetical protein HY720_30170, partial [Planctomycetes bacterium]|nr:hypothetical protein [Planctomycetota bacterium]